MLTCSANSQLLKPPANIPSGRLIHRPFIIPGQRGSRDGEPALATVAYRCDESPPDLKGGLIEGSPGGGK